VAKVDKDYSLYRTYVIFRTLGLRHLVVVNVHNHVVGIITRKDLMPFRMQERLETLLEQTTTLAAETQFELNGDIPKHLLDSGKGSTYSTRASRTRSSDGISNQSGSVRSVTLPAVTRSSSMNKISLSGGLDKDDDTHSINSIHSLQSISSAASEPSDKDPDQTDAVSMTHIVVTVSPPVEDVTPDDQNSAPQV